MWPLNNFPPQMNMAKSSFMPPMPNSNPFMNFGLQGLNAGLPAVGNSFFQPRPISMGNLPNSTMLPWMNYAPTQFSEHALGNIKRVSGEGLGSTGGLSGNASISGTTFRSLDGEVWTPNLKSCQSYNLLSTGNLQVNGTFEKRDGEMIMSQVAFMAGGSLLTLSADGTLLVDGKEFKKNRNDMGGALKRDGNTYTLTTEEGYVFTLRAGASNGVSMRIKATNVAPDAGGLLGSANDGDKQTESKLRSDIRPRNFETDNILTFDNVKTTSKAKKDLDLETLLWASRNPKLDNVELKIGSTFTYAANGSPVADWRMNALTPGSHYLLFSEENLSVSGTFGASADGSSSQPLQTVSVVIDGAARTVRFNGSGNLEVVDNGGNIIKVPGLSGNGVTFPATNADGESYNISVTRGPNRTLNLSITGTNVGANDIRSGGLLGDVIGTACASGNDDNGAGLIRNADGGPSTFGSNMRSALRAYVLSTAFQTESERGAEEVQEALTPGTTSTLTTYENVMGKTWGDPHFVGADGELYDVQGKAGTIYNIVSDQGLQVNALFGAWNNSETMTVMKKLGFSVNGHKLEVGVDEAKRIMTYSLDGVPLTAANMPNWISLVDGKLVVKSDYQGEQWEFNVLLSKTDGGDYLDLKSKAIRIDNHVQSAGIWGHSIGDNSLFKGNFVGPNNENLWRSDLYNKGGSGILRNKDGTTLAFDKKEGSAEHTTALANYVETGLFSTQSFWSQYNK